MKKSVFFFAMVIICVITIGNFIIQSTFAEEYTPDSDPSRERCRTIKQMFLEEGSWTARFGEPVEPAECKRRYYDSQWNEIPEYTLDSDPSRERCRTIKQMFLEEGNWTARFGEPVEPAECKRRYYDSQWNEIPESPPSSVDPSRERCEELKYWYDQDLMTDRFGPNVTDEAKKCKQLYYHSQWDEKGGDATNTDNLTLSSTKGSYVVILQKGETVRFTGEIGNDRTWDAMLQGVNTNILDCRSVGVHKTGSAYWDCTGVRESADSVSEMYFYADNKSDNPSNHIVVFVGGPDSTRCKEVKSQWDQGNYTARFGSSSIPAVCKILYYGSRWDVKMEDSPIATPYVDSCESGYNRYGRICLEGTRKIEFEEEISTEDIYSYNPFSDISDSDGSLQAKAAKYVALTSGALQGYQEQGSEDVNFKPEKNTNRAEVAKIAVIMKEYLEGKEITCSANISFPDVPEGEWYTEYVRKAVCSGILKGKDNGAYYDPAGNITRAEFLAVLVRMFAFGDAITNQFEDVYGNDWYYTLVGNVMKHNLLPQATRRFFPNNPATRGEIVIMIHQAEQSRRSGS